MPSSQAPSRSSAVLLAFRSSPCGCATLQAAGDRLRHASAAVLQRRPPRRSRSWRLPKPLPLAGPAEAAAHASGAAASRNDPVLQRASTAANAAARVQPARAGYFNAMQVYPCSGRRALPGLCRARAGDRHRAEPGEQLSAPVRSRPATPCAGSSATPRAARARPPRPHPGQADRPDLATNLVINTDRRTYHLELRSTEETYMASVSWSYPHDELIALRAQDAAEAAAVTPWRAGSTSTSCTSATGSRATSRPGGRCAPSTTAAKVYIEFPDGIAQGEMPPLFVVGANGKTGDLVNYRVDGHLHDRRPPVRRGRAAHRRQGRGPTRADRPHRRSPVTGHEQAHRFLREGDRGRAASSSRPGPPSRGSPARS